MYSKKIQVSHEKASHTGNYFKPCLNLRKTYGSFEKTSEISVNCQKLLKCFKPVFEELKQFIYETFGKLLKQFKSVFQMFLWFFKKSRKSSDIFGSVRKYSENFRNGLKVIFRCFHDFLKSLEIFGSVPKSLENFWMWSEMFVMVRRSWRVLELAFEKSSNYGGPQVPLTGIRKSSRQKRKTYGKKEKLTAIKKSSQQKRKAHGKKEKLTAKKKSSRQERKAHSKKEKLTAKRKACGKVKIVQRM